jgi:hypothetical protein
VWSGEHFHASRTHHDKPQISINLWVGLFGDCLIGLHILPARVESSDSLISFEANLSGLSELVSFNTQPRMKAQHDDSPAHYSSEVPEGQSETILDAEMVADVKL